MSLEKLIDGIGSQYLPSHRDALPRSMSSSHSFRYCPETTRIFDELPKATIVSVSRPDASDISPLLLSYTIELQYKQATISLFSLSLFCFTWRLLKKASQVIYLHFALKKRAIIEEFHEKQEQAKEWLQNIGIGDQTAVVRDDDEPDDGAVLLYSEESAKNRYVPSRAALPIIRPALGRQQTISDKAKAAMQGYLNHFLGNMDIVNSQEVCKFLEVSKLSFSQEYGPKLKEGYVMVKHLAKIPRDNADTRCCMCCWSGCCNNNWQKQSGGGGEGSELPRRRVSIRFSDQIFCKSDQIFCLGDFLKRLCACSSPLLDVFCYCWVGESFCLGDFLRADFLPNMKPYQQETAVRMLFSSSLPSASLFLSLVWAVLKPGFLALLEDPFDVKLLDIIVFDLLPASNGDGKSLVSLADEIKERNPLRYAFKVSCGNRSIKLRTTSYAKVRDWVSAINDAGLWPPEGWCNPHRFGSFAPPRGLIEDGSQAQWFIDGKAAFEAIASSIESAKSEIYITGWWLCPEVYLRRPFHSHGSTRLDALLETKAKEGVKIYILLYKEVSIALKINSLYSKKKLLNIHENVRVLRYPDHFSTGVYLWSHHEKLVIVDHHICFMGGLDLCFGRYDTIEHKVGDCPPFLWPGKDYYNPRESEPNSWEDAMKDELERGKYPRMPWHDVHCALWGPPCRDVARHFVQRWNHAKRSKAPNEQTIPLLMPQHHMVIPHYMGRSRKMDIESNTTEVKQKDISRQDSFSSRSPLEDIPLLLPQEAGGLDASNINSNLNGLDQSHYHLDQPSRSGPGPSFFLEEAKVEPLIPDMQIKGFVDDFDSLDLQHTMIIDAVAESGLQISDEWWETQEKGCQVVSPDETSQIGSRTSCRCQVIRSVSQWSAGTGQTEDSIHKAYCSLIDKAEHFVYIENQFFISGLSGDDIIQNRVLEAIYRRIIRAHKEQKCFRVIIVIPLLPGFQGGLDDGGAATVRAIMHWQYRTICRGNNSILYSLNALLGPKTYDYISFYGLRTYGRLFDGGPVVTSQVYVHSKVMIIDDRISLVGSSNVNDRSLLGSRDTEIGVLIEDNEFVESSMNGQPWKAGKFSFTLRLSLWSEHLGLPAREINQIKDPIADATYKDLWLATSTTNSLIYQDVFSCIPTDLIHSRSALRQSASYWKEKLGHTTIDLGVAPEKLELFGNGKITSTYPMEMLNR
ncbi:unnamed protein product [Ilex paraguariensis]|uniref:Phospholipase n=1 Tax=Ilex paraguariensis TaxID=185542 RepID=A0ABC8TBR0_9AQUA